MTVNDLAMTVATSVAGSIGQQWIAAGIGFLLIFIFRPLIKTRKIQPRPFDRKQFWFEVRWSAMTLVFSSLIGFAIQWGEANHLTSLAEEASAAQVAFEFALYFVLFDAYFYFLHRAMHHPKVYWVHKIHHRSFAPEPLTAFSFHPIEGLITGGFMLVMVFVFQVHGVSLALIVAFGVTNSVLIHSGYDLFPRWWYRNKLTGWFLTPMFHDKHHSKVVYNFGGFTTVWDRVFGTVAPGYDEFARLGADASNDDANANDDGAQKALPRSK